MRSEDTMQRKQAASTTTLTTKGHRSQCCDQPEQEIGRAKSKSKLLNKIKVVAALHPFRIGMICLLVLLVLLFVATAIGKGVEVPSADEAQNLFAQTKKTKSKQPQAARKPLPDLSKYDNCTLPMPRIGSRSTWTTKPLWFPSYPNSMDDNIIKSAITSITGLNAGAKSFYASSRRMGLRQCIGKTETASCLNIHPMVLMTTDPTSNTKIFAPPIVYILRNPATAMPAFLNHKRIKYAKLPGQTPLDEWRSSRNQFLSTGLWDGYINQLRTWHDYTTKSSSSSSNGAATTTSSSPYYTIGMYLVWEHWMDPERGPTELVRLARLLSKVGFPILFSDDSFDLSVASCIWYRSIGGKEALEQFHKRNRQYEFSDYVPGYTKEQKEMMLGGLSTLMADYSNDSELVAILNEYADAIREYPDDEKWVNQTTKS